MLKMSKLIPFVITLCLCLVSVANSQQDALTIELQQGEKIWSGIVVEGEKMPHKVGFSSGFYSNQGNQIQPLLLSNKGLYVWSEQPYKFEIKQGQLRIYDTAGEIKSGREGNNLKQVRRYASEQFFPPSGELPPELLFSAPQYNTWIELNHFQNQKDILKYARGIVDNGFDPGVMMIDNTWQEDHGIWDFHSGKFPDPKAMVDQLHQMGFQVMLWVSPFVSPDRTLTVRELRSKKAFVLQKNGKQAKWSSTNKPAIVQWWSGYSTLLDFSNPTATEWFTDKLDYLQEQYGVDGFKFDAGDTRFYENTLSKGGVSPNEHSRLFAEFGLEYPLNEYRACWKMAGKPIVQRLRDKGHDWDDLRLLIPHMSAAQIAGYTFTSPDMIGGGELGSFKESDDYDQELVVRSAQVQALMPMMQFSVAPWRILSEQNLEAVKRAVEIREEFKPLIMELAEKAADTGEPIVSNMAYHFPNRGFEDNQTQFVLGDDIIVAPMVTKGHTREVRLPSGTWVDDKGKKYDGGQTYTIDVPIDRLPYFESVE